MECGGNAVSVRKVDQMPVMDGITLAGKIVPYFCMLFTRIYGMMPGEYHKKYQN